MKKMMNTKNMVKMSVKRCVHTLQRLHQVDQKAAVHSCTQIFQLHQTISFGGTIANKHHKSVFGFTFKICLFKLFKLLRMWRFFNSLMTLPKTLSRS